MTTVTATGKRDMMRLLEEMMGRECTAAHLDQLWSELRDEIAYDGEQYSFADDGAKFDAAVKAVATHAIDCAADCADWATYSRLTAEQIANRAAAVTALDAYNAAHPEEHAAALAAWSDMWADALNDAATDAAYLPSEISNGGAM